MKPSADARAGFVIILLATLFTYGLIRVFSLQFSTGEVYPEYSSMRSSPQGAKLLYDSLERTRDVTVARSYYPLEYLEDTQSTILFLGVRADEFAKPTSYLSALERLANRGDRVVAALTWRSDEKPDDAELFKRWHLKLALDPYQKHIHRLYIADAPGWRVLERDGPKILSVERDFQQGSVVLLSDSTDFANDVTVGLNQLDKVSAAIGPNHRVVFDEAHFGMAESGTVIGLARRFRLTGMAMGLAFCAALFLWKNAASFPPPTDAPRPESLAGRTSLSGLYTLLNRHIRPEDLASTCWNEWLLGKRREIAPDRIVRAEAILRDRGRPPLEAVREIQTVLQSKGPL